MEYFSQNLRYGQETVQLHFNSPSEINAVQQSVPKKWIYKRSYFIQRQSEETSQSCIWILLCDILGVKRRNGSLKT